VGLLKGSTLIGTYPIPPLDITPLFVASINMLSTTIHETTESYEPWIVPSPSYYLRYDDKIPLSLVESTYKAIKSATPTPPSLSDSSPDLFHVIFPIDDMIMLVMSMEDTPWDDGNHCSIIFLEHDTIERYQWILTMSTVVISSVPESTHDVLYEGNLSDILPTIPLDISIKPRVMENVHIGASYSTDEFHTYKPLFQEFCDVFSWSYEEITSIDPNIDVHDIKTYLDAKPIR
jgi:hypothetical protein